MFMSSSLSIIFKKEFPNNSGYNKRNSYGKNVVKYKPSNNMSFINISV